MTRLFWDTNLFIYQWDTRSIFHSGVIQLRKKMVANGAELVTSAMTLGELMAGPRREGQEAVAVRFRAALEQSALIIPFDERAADIYSTIRAQGKIRQPDAIQLACAAAHGVELFVTNDGDLGKVRVPGIHFVVSVGIALTLIP